MLSCLLLLLVLSSRLSLNSSKSILLMSGLVAKDVVVEVLVVFVVEFLVEFLRLDFLCFGRC